MVLLIPVYLQAQEFTVMTYNIRYDNQWDTVNSWEQRKAGVFKIIEESHVDIFGVQEALQHQIEDLQSAFPGYEYLGVGRDDGKTKGEYSAIFFNSKRFELLEGNTFWLSKTPEKPSVGWDAAMERICTYALFKDLSTNNKFWVFNSHFDHMGKKARKNSAKLILKQIEELTIENAPIILMGDFNTESHEKPYRLLQDEMSDWFYCASNIQNSRLGTFNGFEKQFEPKRIDYIYTKNICAKDYRQCFDTLPNGNYPSDHFPVLLDIFLSGQ